MINNNNNNNKQKYIDLFNYINNKMLKKTSIIDKNSLCDKFNLEEIISLVNDWELLINGKFFFTKRNKKQNIINFYNDKKNNRLFSCSLLIEEFSEFLRAESKNDIIEIADAIGDMLFIIINISMRYKINFKKIIFEVLISNFSKILNQNDNYQTIIKKLENIRNTFDEDKNISSNVSKVKKTSYFFKPDIKDVLINF